MLHMLRVHVWSVMTKRIAFLLLAAAVALALGLGPSYGGTALVDGAAAAELATGGEQDIAQLILYADRAIMTSFADSVAVTALALDSWGTPLAGVPVVFWLDVPDAGWLTEVVVYTDENGVATTWFVPEFYFGEVGVFGAAYAWAWDGWVWGQAPIGIYCGGC